MAKDEFKYKGQNVVVATTIRKDGGFGFGVVIDASTVSRGGYAGTPTERQALEDGIAWAQRYVDELPPTAVQPDP